MKNQKVFVSGGAGVIGCELVQMLVAQGAMVMVGDLKPKPLGFPKNVIYRRGDLNFLTQQEVDSFKPELFIHLAATFERSEETYGHWEENFWHNIRLSNHLMTLMCNTSSLRRVVFASSYLIYDKEIYTFGEVQKEPVALKESYPIVPRNLTGLAKLSHEVELEFLAKFRSDQFSSVSARIFRGYGKDSRDVISRWVRDLLANKKINVYGPEACFDYIYAQDSAEGLIRLAQSNHSGIVNLGTGKSRRVKEVIGVLRNFFPDMEIVKHETNLKLEFSEADTTQLQSWIDWKPTMMLEDTIPEIIDFERNRPLEHQFMIGNVLITSISRKVPMIEAVKKGIQKCNGNVKLYGGDLNPNCIGRNFVDQFWEMPSINQLTKEDILTYCKAEDIKLIIPSRDGELPFYSELKELLSKEGIQVLISNPTAVGLCLDKILFSQKVKGAVYSSLDIEDIKSERYVVKERFGAGSKSIGIDLDKDEALKHAEKLDNPIFQPFILGMEVSIDAYISKNGTIKGLIIRERNMIVNGESQVTTTISNKEFETYLMDILQSMDLYGHVVLQAIISDHNDIHLIECNCRFGGASTLSVRAGLDSFYWSYLESNGENLDEYPFFRSEKELSLVRYPSDQIS